MTDQQTPAMVLRDAEGQFYLLTPELLAQARVPADKTAELAALLRSDDTGGFVAAGHDPMELVRGGGLRLVGAVPTLTPDAALGYTVGQQTVGLVEE